MLPLSIPAVRCGARRAVGPSQGTIESAKGFMINVLRILREKAGEELPTERLEVRVGPDTVLQRLCCLFICEAEYT